MEVDIQTHFFTSCYPIEKATYSRWPKSLFLLIRKFFNIDLYWFEMLGWICLLTVGLVVLIYLLFHFSTAADDNCPWTHNPDQADTDADGVGDVCALDLTISAIEITQGIQDEDNTIPLVAGKVTYARVYVDIGPTALTDTRGNPINVNGILYLTDAFGNVTSDPILPMNTLLASGSPNPRAARKDRADRSSGPRGRAAPRARRRASQRHAH